MKSSFLLTLGSVALVAMSLLGCKKDDDKLVPLDPDRPRHLVLAWTKVGPTPAYVSVWTAGQVVCNRTITASGQWDTTARPSQLPVLAADLRFRERPPAGNSLHIVVQQDGQPLPGYDNWLGERPGVAGVGSSIVTLDIRPDATR